MKINLTLGELSEIKKTLVAISEETGETLIQDFKDEIKRSKGLVSYKLKGINVISQCLECGCTMDGRARDEIKIYTFDFEEEK